MPDLPDTFTVSVDVACRLLGVGRAAGYAEIQKTNTLAGVAVLRVGRLIRVPSAPLRALLGIGDPDDGHDRG